MNSGESQILIETVPRLLYPFENSNLKSNDKLILVSIEYKLVVGNRRSDVMVAGGESSKRWLERQFVAIRHARCDEKT